MATVCVETGAFAEGRFWKFIEEMGFTRETGIGALLCLWHDSQERKFVQGSRDEIVRLLSGDRDKLFNALMNNDYIKRLDLDSFEITGNKKRLIETGDSSPADLPAKQKKARKREPAKSTEVWQAYQEEYRKKYHEEPPPPGPTGFSQLCILVSTYGKEKAIEVVRHYFAISDSYYVRTFYPIGILIKQRHQIYASMTTGITMNKAKVIRMEKTQAFQQTLSDIESGVI